MQLKHSHLIQLDLQTDLSAIHEIGSTPAGGRRIVPISGGTFSGERLNGKVLPGGHDWVLDRSDGVMQIDVRLVLETDDDVLIYLNYQGRLIAAAEVKAKIATGANLNGLDWSLTTVAKFECGDEQYAWLNDVIAVGIGAGSAFAPSYQIYQIG